MTTATCTVVCSLDTPHRLRKDQRKKIDAYRKLISDKGYTCCDRIRIYQNGTTTTGGDANEEPILFCREALACGQPIENQYYPSGDDGLKGGRKANRMQANSKRKRKKSQRENAHKKRKVLGK